MRDASTMTGFSNRAARTILVVLVLIGVGAVVGRAALLPDMATRLEPVRLALLQALGLDDPLMAERADAVARFDRRFALHPVATVVHVVSGGLFLMLVPLQLSRRFRTRHLALHRVIGRVALAAGCGMVLSALYFGLLMPFAGTAEAITMSLVSAWYAFATIRAVLAIRNGDPTRHREWMLRAIAVPLGVSLIRIAGLVLELALVERGLGPELMFNLALWSGWLSSIGAIEAWIRATRPLRSPSNPGTLATVSSGSFAPSTSPGKPPRRLGELL